MEAKRTMHASVFIWVSLTALFSQSLQAIRVESALDFGDEKNFYFPPVPGSTTPPTVSYSPPPHSSGDGHFPTPKTFPQYPTPTPPTGNGGGTYYPSPPIFVTPPTFPSPPIFVTPPTFPSPIFIAPPTTPSIAVPPPFAPKSPPFTCTYWRNHPTLIVGVFGWWGTVGTAFGVSSLPDSGEHMDLLHAISNTRKDGIGELYRQGTAALLNSMAHARKFPYTAEQVRECFVAALMSSKKAAEAQAHRFKMANEGRIKHGE